MKRFEFLLIFIMMVIMFVLGLLTMHKVNRIEARYVDAHNEVQAGGFYGIRTPPDVLLRCTHCVAVSCD